MQTKTKYQGFVYVKKKNLANGWKSYECERRRTSKTCLGKVKINGAQIQIVKNHTHTPNPVYQRVWSAADFVHWTISASGLSSPDKIC